MLSDNSTKFKNKMFETNIQGTWIRVQTLYSTISPSLKWQDRRLLSFP